MPEIKKEQKAAAPCPLYKKCGGCQLQNLNYEEQLRWKERRMIGLMGQFGHVEPVIGMERPLHYRNKVQAAFGLDRKKRIISGVYQSSTHRIVPVDRCMIENEAADAIIVTVRRLLADFKLLPWARLFTACIGATRFFDRAGYGSTGDGVAGFPFQKPFCRCSSQKAPGDHNCFAKYQSWQDEPGAGHTGKNTLRPRVYRR